MDKKTENKILAETKEIYDAIAPDFANTRGKWWQGFGGFNRYVKKGGKVLDLGCGNGRMADIFAGSGIEYLGVDNSAELIKIARARHAGKPWVKFEVGDIINLDINLLCHPRENGDPVFKAMDSRLRGNDNKSKGCFDLVLLIAVLHHIPTKELRLQILKDIYSVLAPGGRLVISNWNLWQIFDGRKRFRYWPYLLNYREKIKRGVWGISDAFVPWKGNNREDKWQLRYVHSFRQGELKRLLRQAGFQIEWIKYEDKSGRPADISTAGNLMAVAKKY